MTEAPDAYDLVQVGVLVEEEDLHIVAALVVGMRDVQRLVNVGYEVGQETQCFGLGSTISGGIA